MNRTSLGLCIMSMCTAKALSSLGSSIPPLAPGMRRIFIVRHGQTDWNVQRRIQGGGADLELNKMGEAQAAAAAAELANVGPFSVVASSHLVRAKRTADHIAIKHPDARRIVDERFGEMRFGKFEGAELGADAEAAKEFRAIKKSWIEQGRVDLEWPCSPGSSTEVGESPQACADRGRAGIEALLKVGAEDDAVDETLPMAVVAHGAFNKLLISSLLWNDVRRSSELEQSNVAINVLDFDPANGSFEARILNYHEHAKDLQ
mmetsp:Transcript_76321/g.218393  ORF Transcript_76321/g.218393 Transcript_76321/m.218393 type:complete len:261 (-) Transcript_76321:1604-2386(-)